ncbi:hypothetical protein BDR04DRAFT_190341 [Suillus decipiens]|nr:hypothetical protein BDR04DRAFT_190341 [Suillus decipiens]
MFESWSRPTISAGQDLLHHLKNTLCTLVFFRIFVRQSLCLSNRTSHQRQGMGSRRLVGGYCKQFCLLETTKYLSQVCITTRNLVIETLLISRSILCHVPAILTILFTARVISAATLATNTKAFRTQKIFEVVRGIATIACSPVDAASLKS